MNRAGSINIQVHILKSDEDLKVLGLRLYGRRHRNQRQDRSSLESFSRQPASTHGQTPPPKNPLGTPETFLCPGAAVRVVGIAAALGSSWAA